TSTAGDIISNNTTVNAGGGAALTGVGVSLGSLTSGGDLLITANGPTSATDPLAGEVEVAQSVQGNGTDNGAIAAVTIQAYDSIIIPNVSASVGSIALNAIHGNIGTAAIPMSLTALDNINSMAGGTTSLGSATATAGTTDITSIGTISFSTLISAGAMNVISTAGDIISNNTTVNAGGGASLTGLGVSLGSLTSGGDLLITANGPTSATDPLAGEVEVEQSVQGNGTDNGAIAAVTIQAYDSITIPNVSASAGSIALTAIHGNIGTAAVPMSLGALDNINSTAGGTTSLGSATAANGTMNITSVGTISFTTLISGEAMDVTSTAGDIISTNTTVNAGGGASLTGVGVSLSSLTAGGTVLITAAGPTSTIDPLAGEVEVAQFIQSNGADIGTTPALTIKAFDAITIPSVAAGAGSVSLTAGGNVAISTLAALNNINSTAGGTTTLGSATAANGTMIITSVGTISFSTLISGGAMDVISTAGDIVSTNTTVNAGGGASLTGVGVSLTSLTAGGTVLIQAVGPTSTADPIAGEVEVAQFIQSNGADIGATPALTIKAFD